jgi:hypothetical protein
MPKPEDVNDTGTAAASAGRNSAIRDLSVGAFIQDLRKFVINRHLSETLAGRGVLGESPAASLSTEVEDLRAWDGWSEPGEEFLRSIAPTEALDVALAPYKHEVVEFCSWLGKWQAAVHRVALEELAEIQRGERTRLGGRRPTGGEVVDPEATIPESWLVTRQLVSV